jgi:hypothetical protein
VSAKLAVYDAAMDAALDHRLELHRRRLSGDLDVKSYLDGLRAVRDVEDHLEPLRREAGATHSRAYELSLVELQAAGEIA